MVGALCLSALLRISEAKFFFGSSKGNQGVNKEAWRLAWLGLLVPDEGPAREGGLAAVRRDAEGVSRGGDLGWKLCFSYF